MKGSDIDYFPNNIYGYYGYLNAMSEEIQYRKTISHTLVLHDPLSQGHILPMSKGKWLWWQSRCFSVRSFCKMLHKMFAEIRGKRREWPSPSLTIYAAHLCGMSAIEKCTAIALRRTSFSSDPQTVNNVSQENWRDPVFLPIPKQLTMFHELQTFYNVSRTINI